MHKSRIVVDLPSAETDRRRGPIEWLRSLFGAQLDLRSGREELTVEATWLVEGLVEGFAAVGVQDVISFLVDKQVVYLDTKDVPGDLPLIVRAAESAGVLDRKFREMHLVLAHRTETLHTIVDCTIKNGVLLGEAEMTIALSSRIRELQIRPGETAGAYADRVRAFAAGGDTFAPSRHVHDALTKRIADELASVLRGARVTREASSTELVRPDARQVGRFRKLGFGDRVQAPRYRAVPTTQRHGAYADAFYCHYYDPYYDLTSYLLVDAMVHHGAWRSPDVHVVDPEGCRLFAGDAAPRTGEGWACAGAVSFGDGGDLEVSRSIPAEATEAADAAGAGAEAEAADPDAHHAGAGTSENASAEPASTSEDSSGSGSSCGSASSCGSSCGSSSSD